MRLDKTKSELAQFLHACSFSPTKSGFLKAIEKGNFHSWPGLTTDLIKKHLPPSIATLKGHLKQEQQGLQSTKKAPAQVKADIKLEEEDFAPPSESPNTKTKDCFLTIVERPNRRSGTTSSDQTGRFPIRSSRGNEYVCVLYDYDSNAILAEPIKNKEAATIRDAVNKLLLPLQQAGQGPNLRVIDNECSALLKAALTKHRIQIQRVPPHLHRTNAAE